LSGGTEAAGELGAAAPATGEFRPVAAGIAGTGDGLRGILMKNAHIFANLHFILNSCLLSIFL
jgi:hypothetical protein